MPGCVKSRDEEGEAESSNEEEPEFKIVADEHRFFPDSVGQPMRERHELSLQKLLPEAQSVPF